MNIHQLPLRRKAYILALVIFITNLSCAGKGLIRDRYEEDFYRVPKLLPEGTIEENQRFLVYSDIQAGWRVADKFMEKSSWTSPKMFIFPFYELYLLGNGFLGAINWMRQIPDYGSYEHRMVRNAIYEEAKRTQAAFILNVGDISADDGRRPAHWASFLKKNKVEHPLLNEIPYLPVIGNHERANDTLYGYPNYEAVFDYPRFYVVEFADAILYILDSNIIVDHYYCIDDDEQDELFEQWFVSNPGSGRRSWLEEQMSAYDDKPFKIVAMHHPPITYGRHYEDWNGSSFGNDMELKRQRLLELFEKHGVQVVLSGHSHMYQHIILRYGVDGEMHLFTGGGGGAPMRDPPGMETKNKYTEIFKSQGFDILPVKLGKFYHYYLVDISREALTINGIKISGDSDSSTELVEEIVIKSD